MSGEKITGLVLIIFFIDFAITGPSLMERLDVGDSCYTSDKEEGKCAYVKECPVLYKLMIHAKDNKTVSDYLIRSVCTYVDSKPIVCCPVGLKKSSGVNKALSLLPDPPECGKSTIRDFTRIVGGEPSNIGSWPWLAAIGYKRRRGNDPKIYFRCGGVIITKKFILTAAHCNDHVFMKMKIVRLGVINLESTIKDNPAPFDSIIKNIYSYDFNAQTYIGDIMLLKVTPITFTNYIKPICLPKTKDLLANSFIGDNIYIAGWGTTGYKKPTSEKLLEVKVPVFSNAKCQNNYKSFIKFTMTHMCAGYMNGEKDACQGDSGGPMMMPYNGSVYSIGIISVGYKCAVAGYPGIYTRVSSYMNWIVDTIDKNR